MTDDTTTPVATPTPATDGAKPGIGRRKFLAGAAVAGAGAVAMPAIARAQTTTWRFQSTWPARDIFHEFAADYVKMVNEMSGGRLKLELLPAGAVVGALQMQDAVLAGALDGGHGVTAYWYGKHKAYSLFGTPPAFGWDGNQFLSWFYHGGGEALYNELVNDILNLPLTGFLTGPMPTQPLGWFKDEITSAEQLQNLKYRTVGLSADLFNDMGAAVTIVGGPDIVPSMDRGLLDAAEFNNPSSDRILGFADVSKNYMLQSYHQDSECFEVIFNKQKYEALDPDLRAILRYGAYAASSDMYWKAMARYPQDLAALKEAGVKVTRTPQSVLEAQLASWDRVIANSSSNEQTGQFFTKVIDSQKAFVKQMGSYFFDANAPKEPAYQHFFGQG